jgi:cellulose synthase/poly-beta-1,6-N-acetylglucosamine synthase-like glycosyltransferase/peptidoglycan/xylan/chitin deacetylase (PgdA/CDA1 family)
VRRARAARARVPDASGRGHWFLFGAAIAVLIAMLLVQGISAHLVGASGTAAATTNGPAPLAGKGPAFAWQNGRLVPLAPPPRKTVALTFDDGPSPYTPKIVAVLKHYRVPAAFFEIGTQAVRYPGYVQMLARDGYEIGNHTFTHVDPSTVPSWEAHAELDMTQSTIAGETGVEPRLFRPPYSSDPNAVTPLQLRSFREIAKHGYVITLTSYDSEDWTVPGVGTIVDNATPRHGRGGIILMHDGGGNRAQTVTALPILIRRLRAAGYRFDTVAQIVGIPASAAQVPASGWPQARGRMLVAALHAASTVTGTLMLLVALVGVLTLLRMIGILIFARRHASTDRYPYDPGYAPPVSVIVPAYNEKLDIARAVRSLAACDYPRFEVIVVDDGSTDGTPAIVRGLHLPRVRLLVQANAGKAQALNTGIAAARHELIVTVDADTVFERDTLRRLVQPFKEQRVGAVSGNTKVGNRKRLLGRWQHIEYVMGFNLDRRVYEVMDCMATVPGAIGAFRRRALTGVGGFSGATLAEDTDVTLALGRAGWRVVYVQSARAWTEPPLNLAALWRQRYRWAYGTLQSLWKHRGAVLERGPIGRRALPYLTLFQIVLPFAAPLIDLFALYGLVFLSPLPVLAFWLGFNVLQMVLAVYAFRLDGERCRVLWALPLQQFVYRQVMYLVVFQSAVTAARGIRLGWQHAGRTGDFEVGGRPTAAARQ